MKSMVLSMEDTRRIVQSVGLDALLDEVIAGLRDALQRFDVTSVTTPPRSGFKYDRPVTGMLEWMPIKAGNSSATIKIVGYHPSNPNKENLPTILSTVLAFDTQSGHLLAIADGTFLTALRTGAASAIASEVLASAASETVGLIGCGAQAVTQLHAMLRVFPRLQRVLVYDFDEEVARTFEDRIAIMNASCVSLEVSNLGRLVRQSDIICTTTSVEVGQGPVFEDGEMKPWVHINAVGSDFPGKVEIPRALLRRSLVCPDVPEQARKEGECQQLAAAEIGPSLVEIVKGPQKFRHARQTPTVFDSTGWALQDHVVMEILLRHSGRLRIGTAVQIESSSADPRDPYHFLLSGEVDATSSATSHAGAREPPVSR